MSSGLVLGILIVWFVCIVTTILLVLRAAKDSDEFNVLAIVLAGLMIALTVCPSLLCDNAVRQEALDAGHAELVGGEFRWLPVGDVAGGGK